MTADLKTIEVTFGIIDCKCVSFNFTDFAINNTNAIPNDKYEFGLNINLNVDEISKKITIRISSFLVNNSSDKKEVIANIESINEFNVVNLNDVIIKSANGNALPNQVLTQFFAIAVSNLRGMYAVKLDGSLYSNAVLPIIDVSKLLIKQNLPLG
jgi:hypothetical protein